MEGVGCSERRFGSFHRRKKFFVSHQMPDCFRAASVDSEDAKQTETAFQLKQQVIAGHKRLRHKTSLT